MVTKKNAQTYSRLHQLARRPEGVLIVWFCKVFISQGTQPVWAALSYIVQVPVYLSLECWNHLRQG